MNYQTKLEKSKSAWLKAVKSGDSRGLELVYRAYRKEFIDWLYRNTSCNVDTATDVFQESVLILYKNIKSGKLDSLQSSIKTYLFAVGKRVYSAQKRKKKVELESLDTTTKSIEKLIELPRESESLNNRQVLISNLMSKMRFPCKDILVLYYYRGFNMAEIAEELEYKSVNVVKVLKVRCMKILRKMAAQKTNVS